MPCCLAIATIHNWHTTQIDFVLAYPQAPIERPLYMRIPKGFEIAGGNSKDHVLLLKRNIYGQRQAGKVWHDYLVTKLKHIGFTQSQHDPCVFFKGSVLYVFYTDDSILAGPNQHEIDAVIASMRKANLDVTVEGTLEDFIGVRIDRTDKDNITMTQPHLIEQILTTLRLQNATPKQTPASTSNILQHSPSIPPFDNSFHYRSLIGKLNYLEGATRPDISYATHQCARFSSDPRRTHGQAVRWLGRYLKATADKGITITPDKDRGLEVHVDADFAGNWTYEGTSHPDAARSRHGYVISYAGCPLLWKSQLQTEITLSSTESEYMGLSYALRQAILIMLLLQEMQQNGIPVHTTTPKVWCTVFEDNAGAIELARIKKYRPRTKHLCTKLHHFRQMLKKGRSRFYIFLRTNNLQTYSPNHWQTRNFPSYDDR